MSTIKVISAAQALEAVRTNPEGVLMIKKKAPGAKKYKSDFYDLKWTAGPVVASDGWFLVENIKLRGMAIPGDASDMRTQHESMRLRLETKMSNAGPFGQFLLAVNDEWINKVKSMIAAGDMAEDGQKIHDLLRLKLSKKNAENPGGKLDEPTISFQIDFKPYPATYPHKALRGLPRTQFFDASKEFQDPTNAAGPKQYGAATVPDDAGNEIPVNANNIHEFVTDGVMLVKGRINISSAVISATWISAPIHIQYALIRPLVHGSGFEDPIDTIIIPPMQAPIPPADAADVAATLGDL